ncbi:MAG: methyltransferase domain-containing protein [Thermoguttaceae bacterium]|nr:methyltransferase domain-containing protein [Thermoguttaceae bacterium]
MARERMIIGQFSEHQQGLHLERYNYAAQFVKGQRVLDIACGTGYGSELMAIAGASSVFGIDISADAISFAKKHSISDAIRFEVGDAQNICQIGSNSIDVAVSFETIEHISDDRSYLAEIRRVLRPGGTYIVSTPDRRLSSSLYPFRRRPRNQFHIREYSRSELRRLLSDYFRIVEWQGQGFTTWAFVFWPIQAALKHTCYRLRRLQTFSSLADRLYFDFPQKTVLPATGHRAQVAAYWVVRCVKPE